MINHIKFDENSFGITQRSLKVLRDTLVEKAKSKIAVVEIPTNDLCCGYLILDKDTGEAIYTGDGFRMDRCGEGGAGYISAQALFELLGIRPLVWDEVNLDALYQDANLLKAKLLDLAREIKRTLVEVDYVKTLDKNPQYVRSL